MPRLAPSVNPSQQAVRLMSTNCVRLEARYYSGTDSLRDPRRKRLEGT